MTKRSVIIEVDEDVMKEATKDMSIGQSLVLAEVVTSIFLNRHHYMRDLLQNSLGFRVIGSTEAPTPLVPRRVS